MTIRAMLNACVLAAVTAAQSPEAADPKGMLDFKSMMTEELTSSQLRSLCVAIIADDQVVFSHCIGDATDDHQPATPQTVYQIGSMTKVFTAALLVTLRERGEVTLDDPIEKYVPAGVTLPSDPRGEARIRLWHLATHSSGLPRLPVNLRGSKDDPYSDYTIDLLWAGLGKIRLAYPTGGGNEYSNLGAALLGQVLSRAANAPYEALIAREILEPLQMRDTSFALSADQQSRAAQGHDGKGNAVPDWNLAAMAPAGGLYSTLEDVSKFITWQLRAGQAEVSPLSGGALRLMQSPHSIDREHKMAFGLGWVLKSGPPDIGDTVWHNGMTGGHASWAGMAPEMGVGVIVLTNSARSVDAFGERVLKASISSWGHKRAPEIDPELARVAAALQAHFEVEQKPGLENLFAPEFLRQIPIQQVQALFASQRSALGPCKGHSIVAGKRAQECTAVYTFDENHQLHVWIAIDASVPARIVGLRFLPVVKVEPVSADPARG